MDLKLQCGRALLFPQDRLHEADLDSRESIYRQQLSSPLQGIPDVLNEKLLLRTDVMVRRAPQAVCLSMEERKDQLEALPLG